MSAQDTAMDIKEIWRSGLVRRWHSNPDLAASGQTNGHHQWGCAVLALHLFPDDHELLRAAVLHDIAEVNLGDISGLAKRRDADLRAALCAAEGVNAAALGVAYVGGPRLKLVDMLEAFLWARHHKPEILSGFGWPEQVAAIRALADELGADVAPLL